MNPISCQIITKAVSAVQAMDLKTKEQLADKIFRTPPNILAFVVVLDRFGVSMEKIYVALNILLVCFTAMKISGQITIHYSSHRKLWTYAKSLYFIVFNIKIFRNLE